MRNHALVLISFFLLFSCNTGDRAKDIHNLAVNKKPYKKSLKGKKVILYGDSISSDSYPWYKSSLEEVSGAEVLNGGFPGYTTAQLAQDQQLQSIFDSDPDIIICLVGGNDTGESGTVGSFGATDESVVEETDISQNYNGYSLTQAVSHLVRKIEAHYESSEKKPFLVLCTTLPQKRSNRFNKFSQSDNWLRKRDAIVEICNKYDIKCIDLYNLCEWDFIQEPYWNAPTNIYENRGVYTLDGLHPNEKGYADMVRVIYKEMSE